MENREYPTYVFEERMESIKKNLRNYCNDTLDLHRKSTSLLFNFDEEIAADIVEKAKELDVCGHEIERSCIRFIAMEQPLATDLMYIESSIRVISHVKRIAYLCRNIAESAATIEGIKVSNKIRGDLEYMADYVQIMLTRGFGSFCNQDISVARELAGDDDKVDDLFDIILSHTTELLTEKTQNALEIVNIIFIARYLERIADRVVNIGERVIFINTHKRPHIEELKKEEQ